MPGSIDDLRTQWNKAAEAWDRWGPLFTQRADVGWLLEGAGVQPGQRILEIGAGTGDQTLQLAAAVGPQGSVVATDISEEMLAVVRRRVSDAGHDNVTTACSPAEELSLDERDFDAAVAGFVLMLAADPLASARSVRAHLKPGASFAATVWGPPPEVPMLALPMMTAVGQFGVTPPPPGMPGLFAIPDENLFAQILTDAGFDSVRVERRTFPFAYESAAQYVSFMRDVAPIVTQMVSEQAPGREDEFWDTVEASASGQAADDGSLHFENLVLLGIGTVPS